MERQPALVGAALIEALGGPVVEPEEVPAEVPVVRFRLRSKKLYLTYPQCPAEPADVLARAFEKWGEEGIKWIVIGRERHQDGNYHLHIAMWLVDQFDTSDPSYLDFLGGQHGNYQSMRNPRRCVKYCAKDGIVLASGIDVEQYLADSSAKRGVQFTTHAKSLSNGKRLRDINEADPGFVLQHLSKIRAYESFVQAQQNPSEMRDWPEDWNVAGLNRSEDLIVTWLLANVIGNPVRVFGLPQLYLFGGTRKGKSSLMMKLDADVGGLL